MERVETEIIQRTRDHQLFIDSLILLHENSVDVAPYKMRLDFSSNQNPYLLNRALTLYSDIEEDDAYYNRLVEGINRGGVAGMHSMRELGSYWRESNNALRVTQIRKLIDNELMRGEQSVIAGMLQVLMDDNLIFEYEFNSLFNAYESFLEQGERDNIRVLRQVLSDRFSDQFEPESDVEPKPFRTPNWQRLYEMGSRAYWIIETDKGTIEVKLDPISAPLTVSSIDSLTRAGVYDGVVFQRVVKNFVIQGGDFDRRDGFGGPDYRIPTEPSFNTFARGAAGIASSGPDTEGSQFFFMHEWAPHLDGRYTIFGEVVRGMDVVDKIQVGDIVEKARMSIR